MNRDQLFFVASNGHLGEKMKITRRTFSLFLCSGICTSALAASPSPEDDLSETLLDTAAFIKAAGFSYNDYKSRVSALVILLDKYTRRGGKNVDLIAAAEAYIEAKRQWEIIFQIDEIDSRNKGYMFSKELADKNLADGRAAITKRFELWESAVAHLDIYTAGKNAKKASPASSKKKPISS